jgi:hypothetical protein
MAVISASPTFTFLDKLQLIPGNRHLAATPHPVKRYSALVTPEFLTSKRQQVDKTQP